VEFSLILPAVQHSARFLQELRNEASALGICEAVSICFLPRGIIDVMARAAGWVFVCGWGLGLGVAADETGERALRWLPLLSLVHAFALPDDHPYRAGVTFQKLKHRVWTGSPG
jgi:hypothetical protein